jgi:hypothetical protein
MQGKKRVKPIPVPDDLVYDGMRRMTLGAPPGLEDSVRPLELLRDDVNNEWWVLVEIEEKDIARKKAWVIIHNTKFAPIACAEAFSQGELTT